MSLREQNICIKISEYENKIPKIMADQNNHVCITSGCTECISEDTEDIVTVDFFYLNNILFLKRKRIRQQA